MTPKTALITGVTGQDGAVLARFLLERGYVVHGMRPYAATDDRERLRDGPLDHPAFHLRTGDLTDGGNLFRLIRSVMPDEIYNLAAQSHVGVSFDQPEYTANVNALGTLRLLEAIRTLDLTTKVRFYQASSSEMFGNAPAPQNEETPFAPCSPYAAAKLYAYWTVRGYRDAYGIHASNGILFNHESPLRGQEFVTRKIARAAAALASGVQSDPLMLGNLDAKRDWGHARDYVEGMWMMLQQPIPGDYVLATGEAHTVREFVDAAFAESGLSIRWTGQGLDEQGVCMRTGRILVAVDPQFFRPNEIHCLIGDPAKVRSALGWIPKTGFNDLVRDMVDAEFDALGMKRHALRVVA